MHSPDAPSGRFFRKYGAGALLSGFVAVIALAYVPPSLAALNYFDPIKRLLWSVLAAILAVCAFRSDRRDAPALRGSVLACLGWIVARSLCREHPEVEIEVLMTWLFPGLLFDLGLSLNRERTIRPFAWGLALCAVLQATLMLLQYWGKDPLFASTTATMNYRPGRMIGTIGYQNQAADFLVLAGVGMPFLVRRTIPRFLAYGGLLAVVVLTGNRGALAGLVLGVLGAESVTVALSAPTRRIAARRLGVVMALLLAAGGAPIALTPTMRGRLAEAIRQPAQSHALASRRVMAEVAAAMWKERPFVGWGAGSFAFQYLDRLRAKYSAGMPLEATRKLAFARETHNDILQFAAEFGFVGVAGLTLVGLLFARALWRARRTEPAAVASGFFVAIYMLTSGLASFPWQTSMAGPLSGLLLGSLLPSNGGSTAAATDEFILRGLRVGERTVHVTLCAALLSWYAMDMYFGLRVPADLASGRSARLSHDIPRWMHKNHALVGAAMARDGALEPALSELTLAYDGYRDPLLLNNIGHVLSKQGRWDAAKRIYREWADTGIEHATALANLSVACEQTGDYPSAASAAHRRMTLTREYDMGAAQRIATLYLRAGDAPAALGALREYESTRTKDAGGITAEYDNLSGAIWLTLGDRVEAEKQFKKALHKNPELRSAQLNLQRLSREPAVADKTPTEAVP